MARTASTISGSSSSGTGGRSGGSSGPSTVTLNGYKISGGVVMSPSGATQRVESFSELTAQQRRQAAAVIAKNGIKDPVAAGRFLIPREVAQAAVSQAKAASEAAAKKLAKNVPGLSELRDARERYEQQSYAFRRAIERGDGLYPAKPSAGAMAALAKKYPRANAYLQAEAYSRASNFRKASAGKKAMKAIAGGESYKKAIKRMEEEWSKAADDHMWD